VIRGRPELISITPSGVITSPGFTRSARAG
jgi:hypothetical protein